MSKLPLEFLCINKNTLLPALMANMAHDHETFVMYNWCEMKKQKLLNFPLHNRVRQLKTFLGCINKMLKKIKIQKRSENYLEVEDLKVMFHTFHNRLIWG